MISLTSILTSLYDTLTETPIKAAIPSVLQDFIDRMRDVIFVVCFMSHFSFDTNFLVQNEF